MYSNGMSSWAASARRMPDDPRPVDAVIALSYLKESLMYNNDMSSRVASAR